MGVKKSRVAYYVSLVGFVFYLVYPAWVIVAGYGVVTESFQLNYPASDIVFMIGLMLFLLIITLVPIAILYGGLFVGPFKKYQFLFLVFHIALGGGILGLKLPSWIAELVEYVFKLDGGPLVLIGYVAPIAILGSGIYRFIFYAISNDLKKRKSF